MCVCLVATKGEIRKVRFEKVAQFAYRECTQIMEVAVHEVCGIAANKTSLI